MTGFDSEKTVQELAGVLEAVAAGNADYKALDRALQDVKGATLEERSRRWRAQLEESGGPTILSFGDVAARNLKRLRTEAGRTQAELAEDMNRIGFRQWSRVTVAEAESTKRKLSLEELLGLAALFDRPVVGLLTEPLAADEELALNDLRTVDAEVAQFLLVGNHYLDALTLPSIVMATHASAVVADLEGVTYTAADWRPAWALWQRTHQRPVDTDDEENQP